MTTHCQPIRAAVPFVVLDAPPLLPVTDAALLTRSADGAVLVVAAGETRKEALERAASSLNIVGGKVLGAVLNRASTSRVDRIRYGDVKYGYSKSYSDDYAYEADNISGAVSRRDVRARRRGKAD